MNKEQPGIINHNENGIKHGIKPGFYQAEKELIKGGAHIEGKEQLDENHEFKQEFQLTEEQVEKAQKEMEKEKEK